MNKLAFLQRFMQTMSPAAGLRTMSENPYLRMLSPMAMATHYARPYIQPWMNMGRQAINTGLRQANQLLGPSGPVQQFMGTGPATSLWSGLSGFGRNIGSWFMGR